MSCRLRSEGLADRLGALIHRVGRLALSGVVVAFAMTGLVGCDLRGQVCTPTAMPGHYTLRHGLDTFDVRLAKDGTGTASYNTDPVEHVTWEWEPTGGQVFVGISSTMAARWSALNDSTKGLPETAKFNRADFGLTPICSSGLAKKLSIDLEDLVYFKRVD